NASSPPRQISRQNRRAAGMRGTHVIFFRHSASTEKKETGFFLSPPPRSCENGAMTNFSPLARRNQPVNDNTQDGTERPVIIITGRVWKRKGADPEGVHVMLTAPDDDSAVRRALESL